MPDTAPPLFSVKATLVLFILLGVPYLVKGITSAEPYPAVIFPSGAQTLLVEGHVVTFTDLSLEANAPDGRRGRLDARRLIAPVPIHYLFALAADGFGLNTEPWQAIRLKRGSWSVTVPRNQPSQTEKDQARRWLSTRVIAQGFRGDTLVVRYDIVRVNLQTHEISKNLKEEQVLALRQER